MDRAWYWNPQPVGLEAVKSMSGFCCARCRASASLKRLGVRFQLVRSANMRGVARLLHLEERI